MVGKTKNEVLTNHIEKGPSMKSLKVLLVNPPSYYNISNYIPDYVSSKTGNLPPLGLLDIATYLKKNTDHSVHIYDALIHNISYNEVADITAHYDVVGITTMTFTLIDVINQVKAIRRINTDIPIVLGGPHIAIYPEESIKIPGITYCLSGEAEISFTQLINALAENIDFDKNNIPGLYWRVGEKFGFNETQKKYINIDLLPLPDRSLLEYKLYKSLLSSNQKASHYVTTAFSSRGCPFKCIFCDRPHLGKQFRAKSARQVVEEIESCVDLNIKEVFFYDDTFTVNKERVMEICETLIHKNIEIQWDIRARVDTVDLSMLSLMKKAGCKRIHFGVEAANAEMMKVLKKGITKEQAINAFKSAKKVGIETLGYFMFGCPNETHSQMIETLDFALQLKPDFAHFAILTPFPGTPLYKECLEKGLFEDDYWRDFASDPTKKFIPRYLPNTLPGEELIELLNLAYKKFYLNPFYLAKQTLKVNSLADLKTKIGVAKRIFCG